MAIAVASGWLTTIDQLGVDHFMSASVVADVHADLVAAANPATSFKHSLNGTQVIGEVLRLPAALVPAAIIVCIAAAIAWRRNLRSFAFALITALVLVTAIEAICRIIIVRPVLATRYQGHRVALVGFDSSFPSGHAARGVLVAYAVAASAPRWMRLLVALWLLVSLAMLEVGAFHAPTDIAGGALLSSAVVVGLFGYASTRIRPPRPG
jgi:membrane-associated phospholipid phosphatase